MQFFYPPTGTEITFENGEFSPVNMEKEIARFLVSSFLEGSEQKLVEDFSYDIGRVLDGEDGIKLPRSQRQQIADAIEKIFKEVSKGGKATVNQLISSAEITLSGEDRKIVEVIGEYSINDLDKEATMSSIFGTPTMDEDSFAQEVRLGKINFEELEDDDFKLGKMKFDPSTVRDKLFYGTSEVGGVIIYSDLGENFYTNLDADSDKYNFLISKGFTKINVGVAHTKGEGVYGQIVDASRFSIDREKFLTGKYSKMTVEEAKEEIDKKEKQISSLKERQESYDSEKQYEEVDKLLENLVDRLKSKIEELEGVAIDDIISNKKTELYSILTGELTLPEFPSDKKLPVIRSTNLDSESKQTIREANAIIKEINTIPFKREQVRLFSIETVPKIERDIRQAEQDIRDLKVVSEKRVEDMRQELESQKSNYKELLELSKEEGLKIISKAENQKYATNPLFNYYMVIGIIKEDTVVEELNFMLRRPNMPDRSRVVPVGGAGQKNVPKGGIEFRREIPRALLIEIEEAVGDITSNFDSLENELEQGAN